MRRFIQMAVALSIAGQAVVAFAQTQPTRPSAYPTAATLHSAFATSALNPCYPNSSYNPTSSCFSGTRYPSFSATEFEFPNTNTTTATINRQAQPGSESLDEQQARLRIEAKGYLNVSGLQKDDRGIWRGRATMKDSSPVTVTLDLQGNVYSARIVVIQTR